MSIVALERLLGTRHAFWRGASVALLLHFLALGMIWIGMSQPTEDLEIIGTVEFSVVSGIGDQALAEETSGLSGQPEPMPVSEVETSAEEEVEPEQKVETIAENTPKSPLEVLESSSLKAQPATLPSTPPKAEKKPKVKSIPKNVTKRASDSKPNQSASGGSGTSGTSTVAQTGGGGQNQDSSANKFASQFLSLVEKNKYYPTNARRAGFIGTVKVKVTFDPNGKITGSALVPGDYHASLGEAALTTIDKVAKKWKPSGGGPKSLTIPISYKLN